MTKRRVANPPDCNHGIITPLALLAVPIDSVHVDPRNARSHPARNLETIKLSLQAYGQRKPIVVNQDGVIEAGSGLHEGAVSLGWTHIAAVRVEDDPSTATGYAIMDNQSALLAEWDMPVLKDLLEELDSGDFDIGLTGFLADEIEELMTQLHEPGGGLTDDDEVPEAPEPICKRGDLWLLGDHRLLCGDATLSGDVKRLMAGEKADIVFTDPPYGVNYDGGAKRRGKLNNDEVGTTIYRDSIPLLPPVLHDHAALYLWYADAHVAAAAAAVDAAGYVITAQIVWTKNNAQFVSTAHYHGKHEPCFYAHKRGKANQWFGGKNEVTVWDVDRAPRNDYHPTQKPVELAERAISNSSQSGQLVIDPFGGSGSTLIACEKTGRKCRMMEIDQHYCDVIIKRWEDYTGRKAEYLGTVV